MGRPRVPAALLALALLALALLAGACSERLAKKTSLTDADLLSRGQQRLAAKKYGSAIEHFETLLQRFPNSPLAPKAQLALGEARIRNGDEVEAESAFDDFLRLHPADDNVPHALLQKGELLYRGAGKAGRDQSKALEAIRVYRQLLERDGRGPHAEKAAARVRELRGRLAAHELLVVDHFLARKRYASAESRARRAAAEYADAAEAPRLLARLARALQKQGRPDEASAVRKSLAEKYPGAGRAK